jgi:hypothetical protein
MSIGRPGLHSEARETLLKAIAAAADGVTIQTGLLKAGGGVRMGGGVTRAAARQPTNRHISPESASPLCAPRRPRMEHCTPRRLAKFANAPANRLPGFAETAVADAGQDRGQAAS